MALKKFYHVKDYSGFNSKEIVTDKLSLANEMYEKAFRKIKKNYTNVVETFRGEEKTISVDIYCHYDGSVETIKLFEISFIGFC